MKQKQLAAIAAVCGIGCAVCVGLFMFSVQGEANAARAEALARYGGEQVEVCVATRDVFAGEKVDSSAMETKLWIADLLPEDAVRTASDVIGKTASSSILKGEVISEKRFEASHNALDIPQGKEAVSVPAKAVQAVGGAIQPGMSVDVYASGDTTTAAIARDVVVLDTSVGQSGSLTSGDAGYLTLAIDPENVQEIIAASNKTSLYFVLPGAQQDDGASSAAAKSKSAASKGIASASASAARAQDADGAGAGTAAGEGDAAGGAAGEDGEGGAAGGAAAGRG